MQKVTVFDVARTAGVGKSTVSNVLNGSGRVGAAARARVLEAVDQLGYRPHHGGWLALLARSDPRWLAGLEIIAG